MGQKIEIVEGLDFMSDSDHAEHEKPRKKIRNPKRRVELDGKTWLQNSISIWSDIRKTNGEVALKHPAIFPEMLPSRLISIYSNKKDLILDPFVGTGATLLAAKSLKRDSIGIELSKEFIDVYQKRINELSLFEDVGYTPKIVHDDSNNLLDYVDAETVQLTITSPPYWDILNRRRTADYKTAKNYSSSDKDLGNIKSYKEFLNSISNVFQLVYQGTRLGGYCCVILMDLRKKNKFYPFHIDVIDFMKNIGFELDDLIIWDRRQEYNNLRPLGYPYVFRVNKVHEYILIFQKLGDRK